ncbi:hypothetical protein QTP70_014476 [Hemibagrus guttatus]|uniref:Reverse transcriptase domain-containing protein n=1 Tax=Hemibagrus guttatus TaxID=175788 RepID=A0AAE0RB06_9TELE|nr:hypothetical protein QTP70_014476 [Hemibagrus guttatus]
MLFVDYSSAFNTIIPSTLTTKLQHLGLSPSLCQWISNFLTGRPQAVRMGRHVSASLTLSTGAPQGCVLSPLLYSLYMYDCVATTNSTTSSLLTTQVVVGLISDNNETAYLEEIRNLENWCQRNNLLLNVSKTKELIVDFSTKQERNYQTPMINESPVERVDSFRYLGVHITQDLSCSCHINTVVKKQHLYHLRHLIDFRLPSKVLRNFYSCTIERKRFRSLKALSELDEVIESISTGERVVIRADFNGYVGEGNTGDEEVMGKFEVKERNLEEQMVVDFAKRMDVAVVNTYFQNREEHRVTYKSGGRSTQVEYILCRRGNLKEISDCKVVVGESVARQHRMVVCRMTLMVCKKKRSKIEIEKKTKWWKLKKEECCEKFRQKLSQALGGQVVLPDDWETTAEVIRETGRKVLGVSSGRRKEDKETWWWNEEVQDSIQRKRLAKKKWDMDRTEENRQEYKELKHRVKREVSKAKRKAYGELYTRLNTREREKDLYRLARQRD